MIAPGRDRCLGDVLRAKARTLQIDVQHLVPIALGHFEEAHARKHTGVVDQNVDRTEPLLDGRYHGPHLLQPAHIGLDEECAPTAGAYLIGDTLRRALVIEPVDRHVGARSGKFACHRATDPLLRARDQNHLVGQLHFHPPRM